MAISRGEQREALFRAILGGREEDVARALEGAPGVHCLAGPPSLHLAAALGHAPLVRVLAAAGAPVNAFLTEPLTASLRDTSFLAALTTEQREALAGPGLTALAAACSVAHPPTVQALLELGADPNLAGPEQQPQSAWPHTPLECAARGRDAGVAEAAIRRVMEALLAAGADPLAVPAHARGTALRRASTHPGCASEVMLAHLERLRAEGQLVLACGDAATDLMSAAAQSGRLHLFAVAHEHVLAACGLRRRQQGAAAAAGAAAAGERRAARRNSGGSSGGSGDDGGGVGGGGWAHAGGVHPQPGAEAGPPAEGGSPRQQQPRAPAWQPAAAELNRALRSAALGGCPAILRLILASPLPFSVAAADAEGNGLLALCALGGCSAPALAALHAAGARLSLTRLLSLLDSGVHPERLACLLALQQPAASQEVVLWRRRVACPVHRVLSVWQHERPLSERAAMATLEVLLAAGYRPTVWRRLPFNIRIGRFVSKGTRFDPFRYAALMDTSEVGQRLRLVAKGRSWSTANHRFWPEAFRAAARALLLANHACRVAAREDGRGRRAALPRGDSLPSGAGLASLSPELLAHILSAAAWPPSAWL